VKRKRERERERESRYWPMCGGVMVAIGGSAPFVSPRAPIHHRTSIQRSPAYLYTFTARDMHAYVYIYASCICMHVENTYISMYVYNIAYMHTCIHVDSVWSVRAAPRMATQPGRTLPPLPARTHAYNYARASHGSVHTRPSGRPSGQAVRYQYQRRRSVHRGTEARAINLSARQAATRHCVYPHVNHYVRPRDIESGARRIPESARGAKPERSSRATPISGPPAVNAQRARALRQASRSRRLDGYPIS